MNCVQTLLSLNISTQTNLIQINISNIINKTHKLAITNILQRMLDYLIDKIVRNLVNGIKLSAQYQRAVIGQNIVTFIVLELLHRFVNTLFKSSVVAIGNFFNVHYMLDVFGCIDINLKIHHSNKITVTATLQHRNHRFDESLSFKIQHSIKFI